LNPLDSVRWNVENAIIIIDIQTSDSVRVDICGRATLFEKKVLIGYVCNRTERV
jgi:hypothetical protein